MVLAAHVAVVCAAERDPNLDAWSATERALIDSMSIYQLGPPPPDPSNRYADNPAAAQLGEKIFNDPRFSVNGKISCSTCHRPDYHFSDPLPLAVGVGLNDRRTMPLIGSAYQRWFFWDGRKDSLWAQALEPFETPNEHGISRTRVLQLIYKHWRSEYTSVFGPLPRLRASALPAAARPDADGTPAMVEWKSLSHELQSEITRVFVNVGKSIAAFIRRLKPSPSDFDRYAQALSFGDQAGLANMTPQQTEGLRIFITKGKCINCHNGPLLTNGEFHHVGVADDSRPDRGRAAVIDRIRASEFGYFSPWSDADPEMDGPHVRFLNEVQSRYERSFKTPSLRDVAVRPPYMHAGQFNTLHEVLRNYRKKSGSGAADEIFHGELTDTELNHLVAFLRSLTSTNGEVVRSDDTVPLFADDRTLTR